MPPGIELFKILGIESMDAPRTLITPVPERSDNLGSLVFRYLLGGHADGITLANSKDVRERLFVTFGHQCTLL